ncbi:MAG: PAS domain-containing protein [Wenzhouxiangellaceae bacterium]|nr:PAS domain-containing protein [Wenzhouxiangellaceae bacterium]
MNWSKTDLESLRQRAERALARVEHVLDSLDGTARSDVEALVEELRIYQAELEVQNQELRETRMAAERGRRRFELLFGNLPLPALVVNESGTVREFNAAAARLLNAEERELRDRSLFRVLGKSEHPALRERLQNTSAGELRDPLELSIVDGDGKERAFHGHVYELPNEFHLDRHLVIMLVDRASEQALTAERDHLQQLQQRFALAQEAAGVGIWSWDRRADRITWDAKCCELIGWPASEHQLSFGDWAALIHPDDLPEVQSELRQGRFSSGATAINMRMRIGQDDWRWLQGRGQIVEHTADGRSAHIVGTLIDIDREHRERVRAEELLARLNKLSRLAPGMLYQYQQWPDGRAAFPYSSQGMREIYGLEPQEVAEDARAAFQHLHPDDLPMIVESIETSMRELSTWRTRYRVNHPERGLIWVEGEATPERQPDGSTLWHGHIRDVTRRLELEHEIESERRRLADILWGTGAGTWEWNVRTGETRFNERWAEMIGYRLDELQPINIETWLSFLHPDDRARSEQLLNLHFEGKLDSYECEARMRHRNGHWIWVLDRGRVISRTEDGQPEWMAGTHTDITARKEAEARLIEQAQFDQLTGLPGRSLLIDRLEQAMARARRRRQLLAVAFIDLDGFKAVNDRFGHAAGDRLLNEIGRRLKASLRESDTVARIGGDEFVAVLGDLTRPDDARALLERTLEALAEEIVLGRNRAEISASIGVTFYPQGDDPGADGLIQRADLAMYRAKAGGKNRISIEDSTPTPAD